MKDLAQVLRGLPEVKDERLLVGSATFDDAGVFLIAPDMALVQTVDFFPPLVDDPRLYGQIAAANSISDCYAMGGTPLTALALVCFPAGLEPLETLGEIMRGMTDKVVEAGAVIVGGHSVRDTELKVGLAVTGRVHPRRIVSNAGAKPGDRLFLTKPLGMGPLSVAALQHNLPAATMRRAGEQMATLNKAAAEAMTAVGIGPDGVHASTDVTGYGLAGHARNIAVASHATLAFRMSALPLFPGSLELAEQNIHTGAVRQNDELLREQLEVGPDVKDSLRRLVFDAETSGGLLIAAAPQAGDRLAGELTARKVAGWAEVGTVEAAGKALLRLV